MDRRSTLMALLGLCLSAPAFAQESAPPKPKDEPERPTAQKPSESAENKGTEKQVDKLAAKFNVPASEIQGLRAQGLGWGEIGHALAIAQKSGQPLSEVMKLRQSGMGWGQISQKFGFKLGEVAGKAKEIKREGAKAERDDRGVERDAVRQPERGEAQGAHGFGHGDRGGGPRR